MTSMRSRLRVLVLLHAQPVAGRALREQLGRPDRGVEDGVGLDLVHTMPSAAHSIAATRAS
ncbi:MAG: hypothetical protein PGN24_07195 [Microbacterium arborescens]